MILVCESDSTNQELLVKICRPDVGLGASHLVCEVVGGAAARRVGLNSPQPFIVEIGVDAAEVISEKTKEFIEPCFASGAEYIRGSVSYQAGTRLTVTQLVEAQTLITTDCLLQNGDRRHDNPNLGILNGRLWPYDYELCLTPLFLPLIGWSQESCFTRYGLEELIRQHVLYPALKKKPIDKAKLVDICLSLDSEWGAELSESFPDIWKEQSGVAISFVVNGATCSEEICNTIQEVLTA